MQVLTSHLLLVRLMLPKNAFVRLYTVMISMLGMLMLKQHCRELQQLNELDLYVM